MDEPYSDYLLDCIGDLIIVTDGRGVIVDVNRELCRVLQYAKAEVVGRHIMELAGGVDSPEDQAAIDAQMASLIQNGELKGMLRPLVKKDGTLLPVEMHVNLKTNARGEVQRGVVVARDVGDRQRYEKLLQDSEEKFRTIAELTPDAVILGDNDGKIIFWNDGAEKLFGYRRAEIIGTPTYRLLPVTLQQSDLNNLKTLLNRQPEKHHTSPRVFDVVRKDGTTLKAEVSFSSWRKDGELFFSAIARDISDRLRVEREITDARDFFESLIENIPDIVIITGRDGQVTSANKSFFELLGYSPEDTYGCMVANFAPMHEGAYETVIGDRIVLDTDYFEHMLATIEELYATGSVKNVYSYFVTSSGKLLAVDKSIVALRDHEGSLVSTIGISRDMTERNRNEHSLSEAKDYLQNIFESSIDCIMVADVTSTIKMVNRSVTALLGYREDELVGQPAVLFFPTMDAHYRSTTGERIHIDEAYYADIQAMLDSVTEQGSVFNRQTCLLRKDGLVVPVEQNINSLYDNDGNRIGTLRVVRDITERRISELKLKTAVDEAQRANEAKTAFLANMSHEIRTPLTAIKGFIEFAREELGDMLQAGLPAADAESRLGAIQQYLNEAFDNSESLHFIINDILDLSKIEASKLELEETDFSLRQVFQHARATAASLIKKSGKQIELRQSISRKVFDRLRGDPGRLEQILNNLLSNAVKFTESGPHNYIECGACLENAGELTIYVLDSGIGIAPDKRDQVFESYRQADRHIARKYGGTGLGLSIVRNLALLMGADDLKLDSDAGNGSRFYFTIPYTPAAAVAPEAHEGPAPIRPRRGLRVLVAEDNRSIRALLMLMLKKYGYAVDTAVDGQEAISMVRAAAMKNALYDVIFMDIQMPHTDGLTATRIIREFEQTEDLTPCTIIAVTANAMKEDRDLCLAAGCNSYLSKPIKKEALEQALRDTELVEDAGKPRKVLPLKPTAG